MHGKHCKWTLLNIFLLMLLLMPENAFCFNVTAQVDRNRISMNDSIVLKVVFEDGEGELNISALKDFRVISRSSSNNISIVNGKYSKSLTAIYGLVPLKQGRLLIPPLKVEHDKKVYTTKPITIEVSAVDAGAQSSDDARETKDVFVEAGLSTASLFTGQQAIYQLRLYSAVRYSNATLQQPSFAGFTAKEVGERKNYKETLNGRLYHVIAVNYVIIPETPGKLQIDPAIITCDVAVKGRRQDPFDDPFFSNNFFSFGRRETRRFSTGPLLINVEPLPPYTGGAVPFSGVVGKLEIKAELDRSDMKAGESATFTVTLSGEGNIMDAQSPEIIFPADFKIYDDSPVEEMELTLDGYAGSKVFKKAIVPVKQGIYPIEPVAFSFFNVQNRQYEVVTTQPMTLKVTNSASSATAGVNSHGPDKSGSEYDAEGRSGQKERVEFTEKDILALKEGSGVLVNKRRLPVYLFAVLFFLPCILFYLLKIFLIFGKKEISVSTALQKKAGDALTAAEKNLHSQSPDNSEDFFKFLHGALVAKVFSRGGVKGESLTSEEVREILTSSGYDAGVSDQVNDLLHDIESARYSRQESDPNYRQELFARTRKVFQIFGLLLVCFSILSASPQLSTAQSSQYEEGNGSGLSEEKESLEKSQPSVKGSSKDDISENSTMFEDANQISGMDMSGRYFLEGLDAYHQGRYQEAAEKFTAVVQSGIHNPYLYYNIGNAWLKAGKTGHAVLWYERAKRDIPLDPDLRFNMEYAGGFVKDKVESPEFDLSEVLFFWKDYLPTEFLKYGALVISFFFFTYAAIRTIRGKQIFTLAGGIFFAIWILWGCTAFYACYHSTAKNQAVVIVPEAAVRSGMSPDATQLFILHAGTKVKVRDIRKGYLKIFFSKGKIGWVSRKDAEVI